MKLLIRVRLFNVHLYAALVATVCLLAGCAIHGPQPLAAGQIAYHVFNHSDSPRIMMPKLVDADSGAVLYANIQANHPSQAEGRSGSWVWSEREGASSAAKRVRTSYDAFGQRLSGKALPSAVFTKASGSPSLMLPRPAAVAFRASSGKRPLPAVVSLSWRVPASPGEPRLGGRLHGPVRLALRAAMPAEVMTQLRRSSRHRLEVAIGASSSQPVIVWRLVNRTKSGTEVLARGSVDAVRLLSLN